MGIQPGDESTLVSLKTAAAILNISKNTAYALCHKGDFPVPVLRVGSRFKVNRATLDDYVHNRPALP